MRVHHRPALHGHLAAHDDRLESLGQERRLLIRRAIDHPRRVEGDEVGRESGSIGRDR